ncbi:hypothetical protein [Rhodohalobacter barkolensis]|uniref:Aromatic hydrocarbon degradation protein n=1 Tax=Rhodohalobacter barkolensis TaxID=2053187 RepID=A0A2N0VGY3_9BACT|nr:hypothetical protein [Rhodohalobacter barkolensis]PKD43455.1 hypothetical protein CWD77_07740 [Rhodohalobacter barkolensis]
MKYFVSIITILLSVSINGVAGAQSLDEDLANSGSFYSGFGFGSPSDINSPNTMGMGLSGVSTYSGSSASISNPAQWGLSGFTQGSVAVGLLNYNARDQFESSSKAKFAFEQFQLVLPVMRNKLGVSLSFSPVTRSDFQRITEDSFAPVDGIQLDDIDYITNTQGSGGINKFEFGAGYRLFNNVAVGYSMGAYLLTQNQQVTASFSDLTYRSITYDRDIEGYSFSHKFGIFANKNSLFGSEDQIALGATIRLPVSIDAERSVSAFRSINNQRTLVELEESEAARNGTVKLPMEINTGLTYNLNRFVVLTSEMLLQSWSDSEYSYNQTQEAYFKDRLKAGFGVQYHPYRTEQRGGFFSNFKYSLGSSYDTGHLNINGEDINTLNLNAGIGFISRQSSSSIDLSFQYGIRGTESASLVKENIWGFKLSLNLAEYMFVRPKFQ